MYGEHVKTLTIQTDDVKQTKIEIMKIAGEQKQQWIQDHAFIYATSGFQVLLLLFCQN